MLAVFALMALGMAGVVASVAFRLAIWVPITIAVIVVVAGIYSDRHGRQRTSAPLPTRQPDGHLALGRSREQSA